MDEKEMAKMMIEIVMKANDLRKSLTALYIVHGAIRDQIQNNRNKAEADLKYHSEQLAEFKKFTEELSLDRTPEFKEKKGWDGILREDR